MSGVLDMRVVDPHYMEMMIQNASRWVAYFVEPKLFLYIEQTA